MRTTKHALRLWENLKRRFNNTYLDVVRIQEINKKGIEVIL